MKKSISANSPGRKKGHKVDISSVEKMKNTIKLRNDRISSGNLTEEDILFLEKKKERKLLTEEKKKAKLKARLKDKELSKQRKILEKENIRKEKNLKRTSGVRLKFQPNRPFCQYCNVSLAKPNGKSVNNFQKWHKYCSDCAKNNYNKKYGYLLNKKDRCEDCNFIAQDKCQLDLVYRDGNKKNTNSENLKTLCANCSRLHDKLNKKQKKSILDITVDADATI